MNTRVALVFVLVSLMAFGLFAVQLVKAGSKTIVVPDSYATIQAAIDNAAEGDTVFVKSGTYSDLNLNIAKSLSLIGEDSKTTILSSQKHLPVQSQINSTASNAAVCSPQSAMQSLAGSSVKPHTSLCNFVPPYPQTSIVVTMNAPNVNISGFTIMDADICIKANSYGAHIFGNNLTGRDYAIELAGANNRVEQNNITQFRGINSYGTSNTIAKNRINCSLGIELYGNSNVISENTFETVDAIWVQVAWGSSGGSHVISKNNMTGNGHGWGINLSVECPRNTISENNITDCEVGINVCDSSQNIFQGNRIGNCNSAVILVGSPSLSPSLEHSPRNNTFYHNTFMNNTLQVSTRDEKFLETSEGTKNFWDNGEEGNFWSDYNGTDANGDGIGDTPYVIDAKRQDNYPLMFPFDIDNNAIVLPTPSPSPSSQPTPSLSSSLSPSSSASEQPTQSPQPHSTAFPTELVYGTAGTAAVVISATIAVMLRKRK